MFTLANPTRQATELRALEGTVEAYSPYVDPAALVKIDGIVSMVDQPAIADPRLAKELIRLQLVSKRTFERERMARGGGGPMPSGAMRNREALLENDLVLRIDDPGGRIFRFRLVLPDGRPLGSTLDSIPEGKEVLVQVVNYHPIDAAAFLEVHLKTEKTYAAVPFKLSNVKLP